MKFVLRLPIFVIAIVGASVLYQLKAANMYTINVDIGENIATTAKKSGAPRFGVDSHWGATFYEIIDMPQDVPVRYVRPGYAIEVQPLFSLTMFADAENHNDMAVEEITLQMSRHAAKSHEDARRVVDDLISQFRKGKWHRYIEAGCPGVTGRSSYLDVEGKINTSCPLDHEYQISMDDWKVLMCMTKRYVWLGDGVIATLSIRFDEDMRGLTYSIELVLQDFSIQKRRFAALEARELAEGDRKGWNSTAKHKKALAEGLMEVKRLEENAVKRGDAIVSPDHTR